MTKNKVTTNRKAVMNPELQKLYDKYVTNNENLTDEEWELVNSLVEHTSYTELARQGRLKLVNATKDTYNDVYSESVNSFIHEDVEYTIDDSKVFTSTIAFDRFDMGYWIVEGDDDFDDDPDFMFKYKFDENDDLAGALDGLIYDLVKSKSNNQEISNEEMLAEELRSIYSFEISDKEISVALSKANLRLESDKWWKS